MSLTLLRDLRRQRVAGHAFKLSKEIQAILPSASLSVIFASLHHLVSKVVNNFFFNHKNAVQNKHF